MRNFVRVGNGQRLRLDSSLGLPTSTAFTVPASSTLVTLTVTSSHSGAVRVASEACDRYFVGVRFVIMPRVRHPSASSKSGELIEHVSTPPSIVKAASVVF